MEIKNVNSQKPALGREVDKDLKGKEVLKKEKAQVKDVDGIKYEKQEKVESFTTYDKGAVDKLKAEAQQRHENLRRLVEELLKRQGMSFRDVFEGKEVKVDEETRLEAQKSIEDGGEHSVDAVATRIVDFAKAISGGDKSKIGILKKAIDDGFAGAKAAFGGELPEISRKTYDEIMRRLEDWINEE